MELVESFVARALLKRVRRANHDHHAAAGASFQGAVLFVDISGYTALAEALCGQGPDGIEQLGNVLDQAFRRHVRAVDQTAGEIACFAGDAFVAYWPADDGNLARAVRQARACARSLHADSYSAGSSNAGPKPALHIGLSAGELWAARLGSEERWHLLLAGAAVREACAAAVRADAGETKVTPIADSFAQSPNTATQGDAVEGAANPSLGSGSVELAAHVPRHVQQYIADGYSAWMPQRRTICALFIRIDALDDSAADALIRYQAVVTSLHSALRAYTGATGTLLLDDKGLVFTLCLGMPHDAHADDALRAVRAGLAVQAALARLGLDCGIGVASGQGVCMPLGGSERSHYWAVGRFMHVAGRLMEAAGRGLLCTEEVSQRVGHAISLSPEPPLTLKGVRQPMRTFRVRGAIAPVEQTDVLYGRVGETEALERHLWELEHGHGTTLWIVGDAGVGKTTLIHYLRHAAARSGIACLSGGAGSVEIAVAYAAWRSVFEELLGRPEPGDLSTQDERRARLGAIRHPQLAPLVNAVVPGFLDDTPTVQSLSGQGRADATTRLLSEVIGSKATSRFLLVLEDCHWMDTASWRLVLRIAQDYPEALIVLTSRPEMEMKELRELGGLNRFVDMRLSPLQPHAIESIIANVLGERRVPPHVVAVIAERSEGNPLLAREYALALTRSDEWDPPAIAPQRASSPGSVPEIVRSLIASRLDALSPSEDLALKAACVVGDRFSADLVATVYPGNPSGDPVDVVLAGLTGRQLIVRDAADEAWFAFQHATIREVAYAQLTQSQRRDLHGRAAQAIERHHESNLAPHYAALAYHWQHAGAAAATVRYSDYAASQALAAGAFEEADRLLSSCIRLAAGGQAVQPVDRIRWHCQLADARHGMGQIELRREAAHQALTIARRTRPRHTALLVAQASARLCGMGLRRLLPAPQAMPDRAHVLAIARAHRHSGEVCYFNNDLIGMICDSVSAIACASTVAPSAVLVGASSELGGILSVAGLQRIGEKILGGAIALAEAADDQSAQAHAHMISCLYHVGTGNWQAAERSAQRCQEICEPIDDRVSWTNAQAVRFWMSHYRCRDAAAQEAARNLRDRARETRNRQHQAWAFRFLGLCALRTGTPRDAIEHLRSGLDCLGEESALNERIPTLGILALAEMKNGNADAARSTAEIGVGLIKHVRRPIGHSTLEGYSALTAVALDAWRGAPAASKWRRHSVKCLRVLNRYRTGFPVGVPRYQLHLGEYRRLSGATGAARRSFQRGAAAASRLGMPWEARRCSEELASLAGSK